MQLAKNIRPLSAIDYLFLFLENRKQPMHVAGLCVFEFPDDADDDFLPSLIHHIRTKNFKPTSPFGQVLYQHFFWRDDEEFDIEYHFHHIALPKYKKQNNINELLEYISHEHSRTLDKERPLWDFHLIEGIAPVKEGSPERFAVWLKIHHSMADGVAAIRLLQRSLSCDSKAILDAPFWGFTPKKRSLSNGLPAHQSYWQLFKKQFSTIKPVGTELFLGFKDKFSHHSHFVSTFDAPKSILNQKITQTRHISLQSFDKKRFSKIAHYFGATTNDIILAVCSGALRRYLLAQNALPDKPLIAFVPISLRKDNSANGNQISFLLANLGTHFGNSLARLTAITQSIADGKARFLRMTQDQIINYSATAYAWAMLNLATGINPARQAFNLIISNVPADNDSLYLHGAKLTGIYPASVLFDGQALNITVVNHQQTLDFGITACKTALPQIDSLLDLMADELLMFEGIINQSDE